MTRPELSTNSKYHIHKNRHYELKHFCLQYPFWKRAYSEIDIFNPKHLDDVVSRSNIHGDPTFKAVEKRMLYFDKMKLVEQAAIEADPELASYILKAVTENLSYNNLKAMFDIPCGKDMYYDRYRRFFWLLDKSRK